MYASKKEEKQTLTQLKRVCGGSLGLCLAGTQVPTLEGDDVGRAGAGRQAPPEAHDPELGPLEALPDLGRPLPARFRK